ncbi:DUF6236 family protein [Pseudomonas sp. Q12-87]|uniref:DUF6236 family protein n=1 Tax=Pseudomonas sp. Q12-87 TaxID=177989 RepID=UPI000A51E538|nr:DUF6236 family protein [Pseudomonas sp. Q12-87]
MKRGIVASPNIISPIPGGFKLQRSLSQEEINFYALYWDRVVIPTNSFFHSRIHDEEALMGCGLVERPRAILSNGFNNADMPELFAKIQVEVTKELIESEREMDWVLHQVGDQLILPGVEVDSKRSLRFELMNALPVPEGNVLVADLLEFKERRADELNVLHDTLDNLYLDVLKSPDQDLSAKKAVADLKKAIENLEAVSSEKWKATSKFDFSVDFNLDGGKIANAMAAGAVFDFYTNMFAAPIGTIAAPFITMLKVKAGRATAIQASEKENKLSYLSSAHSEKIITI